MFSGLLIANSIRIVRSTDETLVGLTGRIVDETKNTLVLMREGSKTVVPKSAVSFELVDDIGNARILVGSDLIATPQERVNKV
ncbi:MAG: ribonuclease P protein subunit [Nitrososphaerales archaeon]